MRSLGIRNPLSTIIKSTSSYINKTPQMFPNETAKPINQEWEIVKQVEDLDTAEILEPCSLNGIPDDVLHEIFTYLSLTDLEKISQTDQRHHELAHLNSLWEHFLKNESQTQLYLYSESTRIQSTNPERGELRRHFIESPALRKPEYIHLGKSGKNFISDALKYGILIENGNEILFDRNNSSWLFSVKQIKPEIMEKIRCGDLVPAPVIHVKPMHSVSKKQDYLFVNTKVQDGFKNRSLHFQPASAFQKLMQNEGIIEFYLKHDSHLGIEQVLQIKYSQLGYIKLPEIKELVEKEKLTAKQALSCDRAANHYAKFTDKVFVE